MLDIDIFFIYNKTLNTLIENIFYSVLEKQIFNQIVFLIFQLAILFFY